MPDHFTHHIQIQYLRNNVSILKEIQGLGDGLVSQMLPGKAWGTWILSQAGLVAPTGRSQGLLPTTLQTLSPSKRAHLKKSGEDPGEDNSLSQIRHVT